MDNERISSRRKCMDTSEGQIKVHALHYVVLGGHTGHRPQTSTIMIRRILVTRYQSGD
jgi:hypothetical protein